MAAALRLLAILQTWQRVAGHRATAGAREYSGKGAAWHVQVVPDDYCPGGGGKACVADGLKPRNARPHMYIRELLAMLEESPGDAVLPGPVNGWGVMVGVRLETLTCLQKSHPKYLWKAADARAPGAAAGTIKGLLGDLGSLCQRPISVRGRIAAPDWTAAGWSAASPGYVFAFRSGAQPPAVAFGEDLASQPGARSEVAVAAHLFAHRYAKAEENFKDKLTWHAAVLLEWDHGRYTTVVELAWLNGLGGYKGKSNWYADKLAGTTALYGAMPSAMVAPWDSGLSEIRVLDVAARDTDAFKAFLRQYSEHGGLPQNEQRFLEPNFPIDSGTVHLYRRSRGDVSRYLLNYIRADGSYSEITRNCQTFAADLFTFLTGRPASVTTDLMKIVYTSHRAYFEREPLL
mmetsp:Transcript_1824/g.5369  ORF Transcript_1824/g.5369 Transcript_1824/m.5369 type:complete len:403 (-) Transcript_1824:35-1243(-)